MHVLYSWLGRRELKVAFEGSGSELRRAIQAYAKGNGVFLADEEQPSPLREALAARKYDKCFLLMDFRNEELRREAEEAPGGPLWEQYTATFAGAEVEVRPVVLRDSKDFGEVYSCCKEVLEAAEDEERERHFLLSGGTSAMCSSWILLGKTLFNGAKFLQERGGKVEKVEIPFDIRVDLRVPFDASRMDRFSLEDICEVEKVIDGKGEAMREAKRRLLILAPAGISVWLKGETGVGKERFARALHDRSKRKGEFKAVNCAQYKDSGLLRSELFGYKKGAFTGAINDRDGLFKQADGGTLFLDEIGECSPEMQAMLLRVLQPGKDDKRTCRRFIPVGGSNEEVADVRVIIGTHEDLDTMVAQDKFRADLLERIAPVSIFIPPLRARDVEDITELAWNTLERMNRENRETSNLPCLDKKFSSSAIKFITSYPWPRNVRQLENAIWRGWLFAESNLIEVADLGLEPVKEEKPASAKASVDFSLNLSQKLSDVEFAYIKEALRRYPKSRAEAAEWLGLGSYQTLNNRIKKLKKAGLDPEK